jgi:hypothetical protein
VDITKLATTENGETRGVAIDQNTLVVDNLKAYLGGSATFTFLGTLTVNRTITIPDTDVDLGLIATAIQSSEKGAASGVATLGVDGRLPVGQLPFIAMTYDGVWNASTNSPTLADGVGDTGQFYRVGVAGTQDLGSGNITYAAGDYVIYNGTTWEKAATSDTATGANTALSNLTTTSINQSLIPADNSRNLGDPSLFQRWQTVFLNSLYIDASGVVFNASGTQQLMDFPNRTLNVGSSAVLRWSASAIDIVSETIPLRWQDSNSPFYYTTLQPNLTPTDNVLFRLPPDNGVSGQVLQTDGAGVTSWTTPATGANDTLSNLASPTNVNQTLRPSVNETFDLGTSTRRYRYVDAIQMNYGGIESVNARDRLLRDANAFPSIQWGDTSDPNRITIYNDNGGGKRIIRIFGSANSNYTSFSAATTIPSNNTFVLPPTNGTLGQFLTTDGNGVTSWATVSGSGANTTLSNLGVTAVNADVNPSVTGTYALGTPSLRWAAGAFSALDVGFLDWTGTGRVIDVANKALTWNGVGAFTPGSSAIRWTTAGEIRFPRLQGGFSSNIVIESGDAQDLTLKAPATMGGAVTFVLPGTNGTLGQFLTTDGSGVTSWATVSGSGANTTLSNLTAPTAINQHLLQSGGKSLGAVAQPWFEVFANTAYFTSIRNSTDTKTVIDIDNSVLNAGGAPSSKNGPVVDWADGNVNVPSKPNDSDLPRDLRLYKSTFYSAIKASPSLASNTLFQLPISNGTSGQVLQTDGAGVTSWATVAGGGETNTASNVGGGNEVFKQKTGVDLEFRTLIAGTGIAITQNASDITIESTITAGAATNLNNLVATSINQNLRPNSVVRTIGESGGFSWGRAYVNAIYDNANNIAFDTLGRTIYDGIYGASVIFGTDTVFIQPKDGAESRAIKWQPPLGIGSLSLKAPNNIAANITLTLPTNAQTSGNRLITNGSGIMTWSDRTVIESGTTAARPASPRTGETYLDLDINKPIWYNGTNWIDATGTTV